MRDYFAGRSELNMSRIIFQLPSGCFFLESRRRKECPRPDARSKIEPYSAASHARDRDNARAQPDAMRVRIAAFIDDVKRASTCHCRAMSA